MMPRIRTVKPELFNHEGLFEAEMDYKLPLRLAFIALFTCCDREGRFRWQPKRLKLNMLPYDDIDISRVLDALVTRGFIKKYDHQSELYGCIPSWSRHQQINNREAESELPSPELSTHSKEETTPPEEIKPNADNKIIVDSTPSIDACLTRASAVRSMLKGKGRERKGTGREEEGNNTIVASEVRPCVESGAIQQIFEHWKTVMHHPSAKLDPKRKALIGKALSFGYSIEQLCHAISGCSVTPHNIGDNDRHQRYDGLHVILRDSDQIDRFIHNYHYPPRRLSEAQRKTEANVETLQRWLNKKMTDVNHAGC